MGATGSWLLGVLGQALYPLLGALAVKYLVK